MSKRDILIKLRVQLLEVMDRDVRNLAKDDDVFKFWLDNGVPDGADKDILTEIAEYDDLFTDICRAYTNIRKIQKRKLQKGLDKQSTL